MRRICILFVLAVAMVCCHAAELSCRAGICRMCPDGGVELQTQNGEKISLNFGIFLPGWKYRSSLLSLEQKTTDADLKHFEQQGIVKAGRENLRHTLKITKENESFSFDLSLTLPENLETQDNLPPQLILNTEPGSLNNSLILLGTRTVKLPASNVWGYGNTLLIQKYGLKFDLLNGSQTLSVWGRETTSTSFRISAKLEKEKDGERFYRLHCRLSSASLPLREPSGLIGIKKEQYLRVLYPPMEPEFKPKALIAMLNRPGLTHQTLRQIEHCLDTRAVLYSLRERLVHAGFPCPDFRKQLNSAYTKLDAGDWQGAEALIPGLVKQTEFLPALPLGNYNPFTWIKSFTQYGYFKHNDGCSLLEPDPFCVLYQDGFRFALAEDPGVELTGENAFKLVRYTRPMEHISVERSWVDTKWNLPGRTVTFSMLTPVIDVEGTDTLVLSNFSRPPTHIGYVNQAMRLVGASLTTMTRKTETIASVLVDNQNIAETKLAGKVYSFQSSFPGRPWLTLSSQEDSWTLILLPGIPPLAATMKDGRFILKFKQKTHIGIVRLPFTRHPREAAGVAEFFAATTLDYPIGISETVDNGKVVWKYRYRKRSNAWNTVAHRIAPLSPLLQLGAMRVSGAKQSSFPTKYGMYCYVEGERVSFQLPRSRGRALFGVNTSMNTELLLKHAQNGAGWQRLYIGTSKNPEETYRKFEETLKFCAEHGIKVLIDPHNFVFKVSWNTGFPAAKTKITPFAEMWERLSQIAIRYPTAVAGYDLYNELGVKEGAEHRWREIAQLCIERIRKNDQNTPIFVTGMDGANPSGYFNYMPPKDENCVVTFHFYTPHAFTHQKVATRLHDDPFVFYPGYAPQVDWKKKIHYGGTTVDWFDRWNLAAILLPVWETGIKTNLPLHCGEFGVIGYANASAENSAFLWTKDVCELFRHADVGWHLWNQGFGLGNRQVLQYIHTLWQQNK